MNDREEQEGKLGGMFLLAMLVCAVMITGILLFGLQRIGIALERANFINQACREARP